VRAIEAVPPAVEELEAWALADPVRATDCCSGGVAAETLTFLARFVALMPVETPTLNEQAAAAKDKDAAARAKAMATRD